MKTGISNNPEDEYKYWARPDTIPAAWTAGNGFKLSHPDEFAEIERNKEMRDYLTELFGPSGPVWMENNKRFFFKTEEAMIMFQLRWS